MPIYWDIVRVPDAVWQGGLAPQATLDSYLLDTLGYDCVLDAVVSSPEGWAYHQFLPPHQTFGYAVVSATPAANSQSALAALFTWVKPFSPGVWGLIVVAFVFSSFLMTIFERGHSLELWDIADFGPRDGSMPGRLNYVVHGVYIAISSFTSQNCEMFVANSVSGRMYRSMYSFFIMLACSCYVANLAAVLSQPNTKTALVQSIASFTQRNIKACVLNRPDDLAFMATYYPEVTLHVVNSGDEVDLLPLIQGSGGACGGAVGRDSALNFLLGPAGDPGGQFCNLGMVGDTLNQGFHAITFNRRFPLQRLAAMSGLVSTVIADGTYDVAMAVEASFPVRRSSCATTAALSDTSGSLELSILEFSGVFVILAVGGIICVVVHLMQSLTRKQRLIRMSSPGTGSGPLKPAPQSGILGRRSSGTIQAPSGGFPDDDDDMAMSMGMRGGSYRDSDAHSPSNISKRLARHASNVQAARAKQARANQELQNASAALEERLRAASADMQDLEDVIALIAERSTRGLRLSRGSGGMMHALPESQETPPREAVVTALEEGPSKPQPRVLPPPEAPVVVAVRGDAAGGVKRAEKRAEQAPEPPRSQGTPPQDSPPLARGAPANGAGPHAGRRGPSSDSSSSEDLLPTPPLPAESGTRDSECGPRIDPRTGRIIPQWDIRL